jgi:7-carboxy-7-deazaguanine synthase
MPRETFPISEIYGPTIQGEGPLIGQPCFFVRFGGCDYRCSWCDSMFAVDPALRDGWTPHTTAQINDQLVTMRETEPHAAAPYLIVLSGGNPCLYDLAPLLKRLHINGFQIAVETQGSKAPGWLNGVDYTVISPKGPSSLMDDRYSDDTIEACIRACGDRYRCLKFVVGSDDDFTFARACSETMHTRFIGGIDVFLQPVNPFVGKQMDAYDLAVLMDRYAWLVQRTQQEKWFEPRVLPQLHVLTWGNQRRK